MSKAGYIPDLGRGLATMVASTAIGEIESVVKNYLDTLKRDRIRVEEVYLFGSFASGTQRKWSDIDLAIVSPDFGDNGIEDQAHLMALTWDVDVRIEPHPFRPEEFTPENPWAAGIMRSGIRIV